MGSEKWGQGTVGTGSLLLAGWHLLGVFLCAQSTQVSITALGMCLLAIRLLQIPLRNRKLLLSSF